MRITSQSHVAAVYVTDRAKGGVRLCQGPNAIYLDAEERAALLAWLLDERAGVSAPVYTTRSVA